MELDNMIFKIYLEEGWSRKAKTHLRKNHKEVFFSPNSKSYNKAIVLRKVRYWNGDRQQLKQFKAHTKNSETHTWKHYTKEQALDISGKRKTKEVVWDN